MPAADLNDRHVHPTDPQGALVAAAATLHTAFARERFEPDMARCPHCVTDAEVASLGAPVAALDPQLVSRFLAKSGTTWGTAGDLRRVVPAILPLAADHALTVSRRQLWNRFRAAGWPNWPPAEADAVRRFALAEWNRLIRTTPRPAFAAHRWLAATADGIDDLGPYLEAWHDALSPLTPPPHHAAAVGHLVDLLTDSPLRPDLPATIIDVFPGHPVAAHQVTTWLTGPATVHELDRATAVLAETRAARRTTVANERLRRFVAAAASARA